MVLALGLAPSLDLGSGIVLGLARACPYLGLVRAWP